MNQELIEKKVGRLTEKYKMVAYQYSVYSGQGDPEK